MESSQSMQTLKKKLNQFVTERDWNQYHHPKNMIMSLSVEVSELSEHFVWLTEDESFTIMKDPVKAKEIRYELADVLHCTLHLSKMFDCNLVEESFQQKSSTSPKSLIQYLSVKTGFLMEHFLWLDEMELQQRGINNDILSKLRHIYNTILFISKMLDIDLLKTALEKLKILEQKYPTEIVKGSVAKYFKRKKEIKIQK